MPFSASPRSQPAGREHTFDSALYQEGGGAAPLWGHRPVVAFSLNPPGSLQSVLTVTCFLQLPSWAELCRARTQARQAMLCIDPFQPPQERRAGETLPSVPNLLMELLGASVKPGVGGWENRSISNGQILIAFLI